MMIYSLILLSIFSTCFAACGDNCARAVLNSKNIWTATTDCWSFMTDTFTPATATSTYTYTPTVYSIYGGSSKNRRDPAAQRRRDRDSLNQRQVTIKPTSIPAYATAACKSPAAYSSACNCLGISSSTLTAPTPLHTVTATVTVTSTVCNPANNYGLNYDFVQIHGQGATDAYYSVTEQECCALCYQEDEQCITYAYGVWTPTEGECGIFYGTGPADPPVGPAVPWCSWGIAQVNSIASSPTGSTGIGPCGTPIP